MTLTEIAALTLSDRFDHVFSRLVDISPLGDDDIAFTHGSDGGKTYWENISFNVLLTVPNEAAFNAEFEVYREELRVIEQARLDEEARIANIQARWDAIIDIRGAIQEASLSIANPLIELKRIKDDDDTTRLTLLESSGSTFNDNEINKAAREETKRIGRKARQVCNDVLDLLHGDLIKGNAPKAARDNMKSFYAAVYESLQDGDPILAKELIAATPADGAMINAAKKAEILKEFEDAGI